MAGLRSFSSVWEPQLGPEALAFDDASAFPDAASLRFEIEPPAVVDGALALTLWAIHEGDRPATLGVDGFGLRPHSLHGLVAYRGPAFGPPGPPARVRFTLPPRSRVAFSRRFPETHWDYAGASFDYRWSICDNLGAVLAHGVLEVRLTAD